MKKILLLLLFIPTLSFSQYDLTLNPIADGYNRPCELVNAGDERLFVVQQPGIIDILLPDGTQLDGHFLDIQSSVQSSGNEQGLLGLAFAPDYCSSGKLYVNYTTTSSGTTYTRISRFYVNPDDENDALENSEEVILEYEQDFSNHNGGHIEFGPDGYLYIAAGDGGSFGDPNNNAQNLLEYLGKIMRIDVSTDPYSIPDDNPFAFIDNSLDEIWAFGVRNPWKFSFDRLTGDLYIADVGQNQWEEVNFQPANSEGGENYGWRCYEGDVPYNTSGECADITGETYPVATYSHSTGGCSVTGGMVYRGSSFPALEGKYLYTDFCSGDYWIIWQLFNEWQNFSGENLPSSITSFGTDVWGEMYALRGGNSNSVNQVINNDGGFLDHIQFDGGQTLESLLEGQSYNWYLDGELLDGLNTQSISINQTGTYSLEIITESGCVISASDLFVEALNTFNLDLVESFDLYPNPASQNLTIAIELKSQSIKFIELDFFDTSGRRVLQSSYNQIDNIKVDISKMTRGPYTVVCRDENGFPLAHSKLVVN